MILKPTSPLNFIPTELGHERFMLLDSLRFTLEMIDYNYEQLLKNLEFSSNGTMKNHNRIFNYSWSLIDHSYRFYKLYKKLNSSENSIITKLKYIEKFRNTIQHLDERVYETILKNNRPIYGTIKCVINDVKKNEVYSLILVSGIFNSENITFSQHAQTGYKEFINDIFLETDTKKKDDTNEINLSELIVHISEIISQLESNLEKTIKTYNLKLNNWEKLKDIVLIMKN